MAGLCVPIFQFSAFLKDGSGTIFFLALLCVVLEKPNKIWRQAITRYGWSVISQSLVHNWTVLVVFVMYRIAVICNIVLYQFAFFVH